MEVSSVQVIANPAAGIDVPVLAVLNRFFRKYKIDWDLSITKKAGDGERLAREAVRQKPDVVAVYGGDGTVVEVAQALAGTSMPMAILPGGTANILAKELGLQPNLTGALQVLRREELFLRLLDVGQANQHNFFLRLSVGLLAHMVKDTDRRKKYRFGPLAYTLTALQKLGDTSLRPFHFTLDGKKYETEGTSLLVNNVGNIGIPNISFSPNGAADDGFLDIVVIHSEDFPSLVAMATSTLLQMENRRQLRQWRGKEFKIEFPEERLVIIDDEESYAQQLDVRIQPKSLRVVV